MNGQKSLILGKVMMPKAATPSRSWYIRIPFLCLYVYHAHIFLSLFSIGRGRYPGIRRAHEVEHDDEGVSDPRQAEEHGGVWPYIHGYRPVA